MCLTHTARYQVGGKTRRVDEGEEEKVGEEGGEKTKTRGFLRVCWHRRVPCVERARAVKEYKQTNKRMALENCARLMATR